MYLLEKYSEVAKEIKNKQDQKRECARLQSLCPYL